MMKGVALALVVLLGVVYAQEQSVKVSRTADGRIKSVRGNFGTVESLEYQSVQKFLRSAAGMKAFELTGAEEIHFLSKDRVGSGEVVFRFEQTVNALPVYGGRFNVQVCGKSLSVLGMTGIVGSRTELPAASTVNVTLMQDIEKEFVKRSGLGLAKLQGPVKVMYAVTPDQTMELVFHLRVHTHGRDSRFHHEPKEPMVWRYDVIISAATGEVIMTVPLEQDSLDRAVYDTANSESLPGSLVRSEGDRPTGDAITDAAYDNSGNTYDFYWDIFRRDSYDDKGAQLISTVHYGVDYQNAFWNGQQMVYGDGDGEIFGPFSEDLSVVAHELTHAVTTATSNLIYFKESGALNEAFSDMMGASCVIYTNDHSNNYDPATAWWIGDPVCLVNLNPRGCPTCPSVLRYMNNPSLDGSSADYYPDRNTGLGDSGHVHTNSGIPNLAYQLATDGGVHPQEKTSNFVPGVGINLTEQIFYETFTARLFPEAQFCDAARESIDVANSYLNQNENAVNAVQGAWTAVGVAAC
mmetsp:Transcript_24740/g.69257  ORF Transcript_24740/g.69257 Transcript_24740/m.69257 type:complete len:522 (-) Transcript_24740:1766-3331(-)